MLQLLLIRRRCADYVCMCLCVVQRVSGTGHFIGGALQLSRETIGNAVDDLLVKWEQVPVAFPVQQLRTSGARRHTLGCRHVVGAAAACCHLLSFRFASIC